MQIGIKLDIGFADNETYRRLYGDREILGYLAELGVEAIETPVGLETGDQALEEHIQTCCQAGFKMSLHPYSELTPANPAFFSPEKDNSCVQLHRHIFEFAAKAAELQQAEAVVNIHPAAAADDHSREALLEKSVQFFTWAQEWCQSHAPAVRPVSELQIAPNPEEPLHRIADNYEELLHVVKGSGGEACWDFGHAVMNHRRFGTDLHPPVILLEKMVHVHCHDVDPVVDHRPLVFDNVPWPEFLSNLIDSGFDGTVILEVVPASFLDAGGLSSLSRSVALLLPYTKEKDSSNG
jgi:sugar phosphate isomerase/epimerase